MSEQADRPVKILAFCDSPVLGSQSFVHATGFGRVARNLLTRWAAHPNVAVDCWAIHFDGWGYEKVPSLRLLPGGSRDWNSPRRLQQFLQVLAEGDYTHVWLLMDPDALSGHDFPAQLRQVCRAKKIRSLLYYPVDAPLEREWLAILDAVDVAVTYTEYGRTETRRALAKSLYPIGVVPHGVDPVFRPLPAGARAGYRKIELQTGAGEVDFLKPGDFLMLNVNKNEWRKDPLRSLEILAGLRAAGVPAKLLLRMMPTSLMGGVPLHAASRQLGLTHGKEWCQVGDLSDTDLCGLYNAADLYLTTSMGEGWGLGITEAMACHCPVAMAMHTSTTELGEFAEVLWLPQEPGHVCGADTRLRRRVDLAGAVALIADHVARRNLLLGINPALGAPIAPRADFYTTLDWDTIAARMLRLLTGEEEV